MAILGETGFKVLPFIRANNQWKFHIVYEHKIKNFIIINYRIFIYSSLCWTATRWSCPQDGRFDSHYSPILLHYLFFQAMLIIEMDRKRYLWSWSNKRANFPMIAWEHLLHGPDFRRRPPKTQRRRRLQTMCRRRAKGWNGNSIRWWTWGER